MGVKKRKCVNIMGFNSPEWAISFYGAIMNGNIASGVYITNGADACQYQAEHSDAQVIVVDTLAQLKLYYSIIDKLPFVKAVVAWGIDTLPEYLNKDFRFYTFKNFLNIGREVQDASILVKMEK